MTAHTYEYPRPALTADVIALRWRHQRLEVLLIKRATEPFMGALALPGGFVDQRESPREQRFASVSKRLKSPLMQRG